MRQPTKQTIDAQVLTLWRARVALLGEKLAQNPSSEQAWFWRVQWDILNYLLHRYGGDEKLTEPGLASTGTVPAASAQTPAMLENQPSGAFAAYAGLGKMPRASGQIRPILEKIVQGNRERYELLNQLRKQMLEAIWRQREGNQEWTHWAKEYLREHGLLDEKEESEPQEQLSDDEIVEMLSKMMEMDERGEPPTAD